MTVRVKWRRMSTRQARAARNSVPLGGVPVTIKECFDLAGTASTFGLTTRRDEIESKDDPYVAALRAAGAIPIAKTNLRQLMIFTETDNPLYGRTNNPWDLDRSCGGSSGGEAAVIAAGASPLGLGNDIGGSLRVPAAFCGITSIRPTAGRTPDYCAHGLPVGQTGIVSQVGPMAMSMTIGKPSRPSRPSGATCCVRSRKPKAALSTSFCVPLTRCLPCAMAPPSSCRCRAPIR
jgi:Asp-tRNA(Asn)/Glu-tRNA(Gln) amidotransferase A subunit family amidase